MSLHSQESIEEDRDAIDRYARFIGVDLDRYPSLRPLVIEGLHAELPAGWLLLHPEDDEALDEPLFFNEGTGVCINEHPMDRVFRARALARMQALDNPAAAVAGATSQAAGPRRAEGSALDDFDAVLESALPRRLPPQSQPALLPQSAAVPDVEPVSSGDDTAWSTSAPPLTARSAATALDNAAATSEAVPASRLRAMSSHVVPNDFLCPITAEVMEDPVITADGFSYERSAIEAWLASHDTSPLTNNVLPHRLVVPNHTLRSVIREHMERVGGR